MLVIVIFYAFLLNKNSVNTYGNNMLADSCCKQLCTVHVILYTVLHIVTVATYKCFALLPPPCRGLWPSQRIYVLRSLVFLSDKVEYFLLVFYSVNY